MTPYASPHRPALILDAKLRQSLLTVRALGRIGIEVFVAETDGRTPAFVSRWCSRQAVLPDFGNNADAFVDSVIGLCESIGSPVIITSDDGAIDALRSRRSEVEQVGSLALSSEDALSVAIDKQATLVSAQRLGICIPEGRTVTEMSMGRGAIDDVGLPVVLKPVVSWVKHEYGGWRGAPTVAGTADAGLSQIKRLLDGGVAALVQPWLPGTRDAVGVFLADDVVWAKFAVRSHRMRPMIGGSSIVRETIPMPADVGTMAEALIRDLSLEGYAEVEFRRDGDGRPFLMEVNPATQRRGRGRGTCGRERSADALPVGIRCAVAAGLGLPLRPGHALVGGRRKLASRSALAPRASRRAATHGSCWHVRCRFRAARRLRLLGPP